MLPRLQRSLTTIGMLLVLLLVGTSLAWAAEPAKENAPSAEDVRQEVAQTLKTIGHYSVKQRDKAVATAREALRKTDAAIDRMQRKVDRDWDSMDAAARKNARDTLDALRKERTDLAEWFGGMEHSSAKAWDEIKKGFAKSYSNLADSLGKAADKF